MNEQETTTGPKVYVRVKAPNGIECGGVLLGATRPTPKRPSIITIGFPVKPAKFTATGQGLAASDGWSVLQADMPKIEEAIAVASRPNVPVHAATFSPDGMYRYTLLRRWGPGPLLVVVMLNPSVASDEKDDPTIRRCMNFAKREKLNGIFVVNLFARISTKPTELRKCDDPIGPENDKALGEAAAHFCARAAGSSSRTATASPSSGSRSTPPTRSSAEIRRWPTSFFRAHWVHGSGASARRTTGSRVTLSASRRTR